MNLFGLNGLGGMLTLALQREAALRPAHLTRLRKIFKTYPKVISELFSKTFLYIWDPFGLNGPGGILALALRRQGT